MDKILIIDDEEKLRALLAKIISLEGFEVLQASDIKNGLKRLESTVVDVVLCDVKLPDGNGVDVTKIIKEKYPQTEVILLTAFGNIPDGVTAIKNGAFDYITKGDDNNKIIPLLYKATEKVNLNRRLQHLEKQLGSKYSFDNIIGKSQTLKKAIEAAKQVATTDATVLITGETGTGKEVFAQAIHQSSTRQNYNFVAINCAAFSKELLENELFGHKAGAYTGAIKDSKGIFEEAHNGTVFLDELGELPLDLQAKLLRVLETGEYLKVGDNKPTKVNVRIIAATHRNLVNEMEKGNFREDLYYRIAVFEIHLPPLRDRLMDLEDLSYFFLKKMTAKFNKKIETIAPEYITTLQQHPWKGNIRELRNVIERSIILNNGPVLSASSLPFDMQNPHSNPLDNSYSTTLELAVAEKKHIQKVMQITNGNKTKSAELLGIALTTLYRKLNEYNID